MLIGIHKSVEELEVLMQEKITANKMELRDIEKEYNDLQKDISYNPPKRGTEDDRPARNLELQKRIRDVQNNNEWLAKKIEEAEVMEDKSQKIYLTLNDCIEFGITLENEEESEE